MKATIESNKMLTETLQIAGTGILPGEAIVRDIRVIYGVDGNQKKTDEIKGVRYDCISEKDFSTFAIKTISINPVITKEELEASEVPVRISIPVSETIIKPYKIEYGKALVTITAPYVRLVKQK